MQARSERTRHRLVRAGADMFDRKGYAEATLGQIAASAGLTKGALYFHFESKDGLADAVEERAQASLYDFVQDQEERGTAPVQALIDLTHLLAGTLHHDPVARASFRMAHENARPQPQAGAFHHLWIAEALALLGRADEKGQLRDRLPRDGARTLLAVTVCGIALLAAARSTQLEPGSGVAELWDQLLPALVPAAHVARYRTRPPESGPAGARESPDALSGAGADHRAA